jgi:hypothetical protein
MGLLLVTLHAKLTAELLGGRWARKRRQDELLGMIRNEPQFDGYLSNS